MTRINHLIVLMDGVEAGELTRHNDRVTLTYLDAYRRSSNATPLSIGFPLTAAEHTGRRVHSFLDGLLPDNEGVRATWARRFQTRTTPFDLLAEVGEDCAGAVQFVKPERIGHLQPGGVEWLDESDISEWIAELRTNPDAWLPVAERGQFSLAGAQSKFALRRDGSRWGRPFGAEPTTHIVKPTANGLTDHEINEHLSLTVAGLVGLTAANSSLGAYRIRGQSSHPTEEPRSVIEPHRIRAAAHCVIAVRIRRSLACPRLERSLWTDEERVDPFGHVQSVISLLMPDDVSAKSRSVASEREQKGVCLCPTKSFHGSRTNPTGGRRRRTSRIVLS